MAHHAKQAAITFLLAGTVLLTSCTNKPPISTTTTTAAAPSTVTATEPTTPAPLPGLENILTDEQIKSYVSGFNKMQPITQDLLSRIADVNSSLYYKFTGNTFENAKFVTKLIPHEEYKALEDKPEGTLPNSIGTIGTGPDGEVLIYVDIGSPSDGIIKKNGIEILRILSRETGQAEAFRRIPMLSKILVGLSSYGEFLKEVSEKHGLGDISDISGELDSIRRESLQTFYQSVEFHYLAEAGAIIYSDFQHGNTDLMVDTLVSLVDEGTSTSTPMIASMIDWYRALNHPDTLATLEKKGQITSQQALGLFNEYIEKNLTRDGLCGVYAEIVTAVRKAPEAAPQIKTFCKQSGNPWGPYFP